MPAKRWSLVRLSTIGLAATVLRPLGRGVAKGQDRGTVTVQQLFDHQHHLEVTAGSEVVWSDLHFGSVWFPPGANNPKVERQGGEFRATFPKPGTYRGAFTVAGGG